MYDEHNKSNRFIGVHSLNTIIEWSLNDANELSPIAKKTFQTQILDVLTDCYKRPIIIFANGHAECWSSDDEASLNENDHRKNIIEYYKFLLVIF